MRRALTRLFGFFLLLSMASLVQGAQEPLRVLFLGDNGHHRPVDRFAQLAPVLEQRGIVLKYTDDMSVLTPQTLAGFDGLLLYANIDTIDPQQAQVVLDFVSRGKGFIPLHCATYCWRNSPEMIRLMGAQFLRHGAGVMNTVVASPDHPVMNGYEPFDSWDETYVHHRHNNENRTVLTVRRGEPQADGRTEEPWTWVRTHGKGRVFYTAWGHDQRTWGHPGFQNLVERGIRWACGGDPGGAGKSVAAKSAWSGRGEFDVPQMTTLPDELIPFEYVDVGPKIPNYPPSEKWGVQEEPHTLMQKPLPPEESVKHFTTPQGFDVRLWAAEDSGSGPGGESSIEPGSLRTALYRGLGGKPIAMNWDERGRLWVCETVDYPNELQPTDQGRDRIRICEDTNGDGQADRFTLFAEDLSIPTAILPLYGGAVVQNGTETLFLKDTDGDDRADVRQVLISGWELGDTHGGVSNFQYGLDNWIWAMQGYNNSSPVIDGEEQQSFRMGFFRFKLELDGGVPMVRELEFIRSTDNNTWGLGFSEDGLIFGSTANRNPSVHMPIPNRYYERVRGWTPSRLESIADSHLFAKPLSERIRQVDHHGGYTAGAGHALYTAREFPQQWWNRTAFVCGPTGKLVGTFVISADGTEFRSTTPFNLLASDDEWSAPIMAEVGPDGAVWVLDWYNYIVQHNPTPQGFEQGKGNAYESDLRDKQHGRIYRVVYSGGSQTPGAGGGTDTDAHPRVSTLSLSDALPEELVRTLAHPTMLWRKQAQRLLVERGETDVVPQLIQLINDESVDEIGLNPGAIHAIWTLHGLGALGVIPSAASTAVVGALDHPSAGVRRNALQALTTRPVGASNLLTDIAPLLDDPSPHVRLAAILALSDLPASERAGKVIADAVRSTNLSADRWIADALTSAAASHALPFLTALAGGESGSGAEELVATVAEHVARGLPTSEDVRQLVTRLSNSDPILATSVLTGLTEGWPRSYTIHLADAADDPLIRLLERVPAGAKGQLVALASAWGSDSLKKHAERIAAELLATVKDSNRPIAERLADARQLIGLRQQDERIVKEVLTLVTPQSPPELTSGLIEAVALSRAEEAGSMIVEKSRSLTPAARAAAVNALLGRPETTLEVLNSLSEGTLSISDLTLEQQRLLASHPNQDIRRQATKLLSQEGGLPDADREKVLQALLPLTEQNGDVGLGRQMFIKHCAKCHAHSSIDVAMLPGGTPPGNIGPNLTGMAVHPKAELLTHIVDPSRSVEGNFRSYTVLTTDGEVLTGMLASETRTSIELIDTNAKRHGIPREDIEELVASRKSVMPDGFEKQMTPDELAALLSFLTQRGRFLPLDLRKAATIVSTKPMFYGQTPAERLIFPDWETRIFNEVPFLLVNPNGDRQPNVIMLHGPQGTFPPQMPRSVSLPVNSTAGTIHMLSGISGWGFPAHRSETTSMVIRIHYTDGKTEDHELKNAVHFADYIRRVDVPESEFAFDLRGRQVRYLQVRPKRSDATIRELELVKGDDPTAPIVVAITLEAPPVNSQ